MGGRSKVNKTANKTRSEGGVDLSLEVETGSDSAGHVWVNFADGRDDGAALHRSALEGEDSTHDTAGEARCSTSCWKTKGSPRECAQHQERGYSQTSQLDPLPYLHLA